jgi:hypothetical protein
MRWYLMLGVVVLTSSSAQAERVALRGDTLRQALAGKSVHLDTPFGVAIPITFHGNGLMSGRAGALQYFLGAEADRGRWWVEEGKLCQKWFKWLDAQPSCMSLQQDGQRIFWQRDDGLSGTATIEVAFPPGAESRAHALGGPIQPNETRPSPPQTQQREGTARVKTPMTQASLHRPLTVSSAKTPTVATPEAQQRFGRMAHLPIPFEGEQDWCHSVLVERTAAAAAPNLTFVARLFYAGNEMPWPMSACFTAEPSLKAVARFDALAR